ncbi:MAG: DUF6703 family protein [Actinomycetes bacterium]
MSYHNRGHAVPESKRHPARRPQQRPSRASHGSPAAKASSGTSPGKGTASKGGGAKNAAAKSSNKAGRRSQTRQGATKFTPGWRGALERSSAGPLMFMHSLPAWLVPVLLAVTLLIGLLLPWRWTAIVLLLPTVFLAWLMTVSWPLLSPVGKVLRSGAVLVLLWATVARLTGRL